MTDCSSCTGTGQVFVACTNPLLTLGRLCYGAVGKEGQSRCPLVQPAPRLLELPVSLTCPPPPFRAAMPQMWQCSAAQVFGQSWEAMCADNQVSRQACLTGQVPHARSAGAHGCQL